MSPGQTKVRIFVSETLETLSLSSYPPLLNLCLENRVRALVYADVIYYPFFLIFWRSNTDISIVDFIILSSTILDFHVSKADYVENFFCIVL